jgi:hypothetical protein
MNTNSGIGAVALAVVAASAAARPLYEKALQLNGDNGPFSYSDQLICDDFTLTSDAAASRATWHGNYLGKGDAFNTGDQHSFIVRFFADDFGAPALSPFATFPLMATLTDNGISQGGDAIYLFTADFTPVNLLGGVKYYFSVEGTDAAGGVPGFRWNNGSIEGDDDVQFFRTEEGGQWSTESGLRAAAAFGIDVPAPGASVLCLAGVMIARRRRR